MSQPIRSNNNGVPAPEYGGRFPTVTIGDATLILGDCREAEVDLPFLDTALISDPPYGGNFNTDSTRYTGGKQGRGDGRSDRKIIGDESEFDPSRWAMWPEVILWGSNHYAQRLPVGATLVWLKKYIDAYGTFLSDAEIGWQRGGHGVFAFHAPDSNGRRQLELTGSAFGQETGHPTQKPIALMSWCIERCRASMILDPYMGSGTTGVAAVRAGKRFVGVEIDPLYFDIACRRISEAYKQPRLFEEPRAKAVQPDMLAEPLA